MISVWHFVKNINVPFIRVGVVVHREAKQNIHGRTRISRIIIQSHTWDLITYFQFNVYDSCTYLYIRPDFWNVYCIALQLFMIIIIIRLLYLNLFRRFQLNLTISRAHIYVDMEIKQTIFGLTYLFEHVHAQDVPPRSTQSDICRAIGDGFFCFLRASLGKYHFVDIGSVNISVLLKY